MTFVGICDLSVGMKFIEYVVGRSMYTLVLYPRTRRSVNFLHYIVLSRTDNVDSRVTSGRAFSLSAVFSNMKVVSDCVSNRA